MAWAGSRWNQRREESAGPLDYRGKHNLEIGDAELERGHADRMG